MSEPTISRRTVLQAGATAGVALATASAPALLTAPKKRVTRFVHLTDMHVQSARGARKGWEACLTHCQKQKPDAILIGGDMVMDMLGASLESAQTQWSDFHDVLRANTKLPVHYCIGNHDVWGWNNRSTHEKHPKFGKALVQEKLEMPKPYYSFDAKNWHVVVLDSTHALAGNGYTAKLDDEQFEWLADDLANAAKGKHTLVLTHIPILAVCAYFDGDNVKDGNWVIPGAWMHIDALRIKNLFLKHPNVKVCLSGHEHLVDDIKYLGVTYLCNGAVSGAWWQGNYHEFGPGYAVVDLFDDGSFSNTFHTFPWTPVA